MPRSEEQTSRAHLLAALAGVAMHAIISGPPMKAILEQQPLADLEGKIASTAVDQAEALLAEIERRTGGPL